MSALPRTSTRLRSPGLLLACALLAGAIFLIDLQLPLGVAAGVPYLVVVLLAVRHPRPSFSLWAALVCSGLTVLACWLSPAGGEPWKVYLNRALALLAIWATAWLSHRNLDLERLVSGEAVACAEASHALDMQAERLRVLQATMRTVHDLVNNALNGCQLFLMEAEESGALAPASLNQAHALIQEAAARLKGLADLEEPRLVPWGEGTYGIGLQTPLGGSESA